MSRSCLLVGLLASFWCCGAAAYSQEGAAETAEEAVEEAVEQAPVAEEPAATEEPAAEEPAEPPMEEPAEQPVEHPAEEAEPVANEPESEPADAEEATDSAEAAEEEPVAEEAEAEEPADEGAAEADEEVPEEEAAPGSDLSGLIERAPAFFALTHHAAVHLPIALWLLGALFVLIGVVVPSWRNQVPLACLIGGAVTSVAAAASGWWYAQYEWADEWAWGDLGDKERLAELIVQHRWIGAALVLASVVLSVIALVSQAKQSKGLGFLWRVGLLVLAAVVSFEGHIGGELIMGEGFLEEAYQEWVQPEAE